jgi:ribosome-binding factor A
MDRKLAKIEKDLLRKVSQLLFEIRDAKVNSGLVSVSKTQVSKDLRVLKVWVTVNYDENGQREVMQTLQRAARFVRGRLGENLDLRYTPEVRFYLDDTPERAARIQSILDNLPPYDPTSAGEDADEAGPEDADSDEKDEADSDETGAGRADASGDEKADGKSAGDAQS